MGIKDEINSLTEKITNINKYRIYMTKLGLIEKRIDKYLRKEIKGEKNIQFNSQDLRSLIMKLEKVHKSMNKSISFIEMENKYAKRGFIDENTMKEDGQDLGKRIAHTIILQEQIAKFNHHATLCFFIEYQYNKEQQQLEKEKEQSDYIFAKEMEKIIRDSYQ